MHRAAGFTTGNPVSEARSITRSERGAQQGTHPKDRSDQALGTFAALLAAFGHVGPAAEDHRLHNMAPLLEGPFRWAAMPADYSVLFGDGVDLNSATGLEPKQLAAEGSSLVPLEALNEDLLDSLRILLAVVLNGDFSPEGAVAPRVVAAWQPAVQHAPHLDALREIAQQLLNKGDELDPALRTVLQRFLDRSQGVESVPELAPFLFQLCQWLQDDGESPQAGSLATNGANEAAEGALPKAARERSARRMEGMTGDAATRAEELWGHVESEGEGEGETVDGAAEVSAEQAIASDSSAEKGETADGGSEVAVDLPSSRVEPPATARLRSGDSKAALGAALDLDTESIAPAAEPAESRRSFTVAGRPVPGQLGIPAMPQGGASSLTEATDAPALGPAVPHGATSTAQVADATADADFSDAVAENVAKLGQQGNLDASKRVANPNTSASLPPSGVAALSVGWEEGGSAIVGAPVQARPGGSIGSPHSDPQATADFQLNHVSPSSPIQDAEVAATIAAADPTMPQPESDRPLRFRKANEANAVATGQRPGSRVRPPLSTLKVASQSADVRGEGQVASPGWVDVAKRYNASLEMSAAFATINEAEWIDPEAEAPQGGVSDPSAPTMERSDIPSQKMPTGEAGKATHQAKAEQAAPMLASVPPEPGRLSRLIQSAVMEQTHERQTIELQLEPESLGRLQLRVALENGALTAQFVAETEAARRMIETGLQQLRESLHNHGVDIQQVEVSLGHSGGFSERHHGDEANPQALPQFPAGVTRKAVATLADSTQQTVPGNSGGVDVLI